MIQEGDPVWVDQFHGELIENGWPSETRSTYEGPGIVVGGQRSESEGGGVLVQVSSSDVLWIPASSVARGRVVPYVRPACRYCGSVRMVAEHKAGNGVQWTCADCMGGQNG